MVCESPHLALEVGHWQAAISPIASTDSHHTALGFTTDPRLCSQVPVAAGAESFHQHSRYGIFGESPFLEGSSKLHRRHRPYRSQRHPAGLSANPRSMLSSTLFASSHQLYLGHRPQPDSQNHRLGFTTDPRLVAGTLFRAVALVGQYVWTKYTPIPNSVASDLPNHPLEADHEPIGNRAFRNCAANPLVLGCSFSWVADAPKHFLPFHTSTKFPNTVYPMKQGLSK